MSGSIGEIWDGIDLAGPLGAMVDGVGDQVIALIPVGIGILFVLAIPRIIRRVVNTFL